MLWCIRATAGVALILSLYLSWVALKDRGLIGCGAEGGCQQMLSSRWSKWLGVPVASLGAADYLIVLLAALTIGPGTARATRCLAWKTLLISTSAAAGAAIWFIVLQLAAVRSLCTYCLAIHGCGLLAAMLVLGGTPVNGGESVIRWRNSAGAPIRFVSLMLAGLVPVGLLIAGQVLLPSRSYRIETSGSGPIVGSPSAIAGVQPSSMPGDGIAIVRVAQETLAFDSKRYPTAGPPGARHFILMLSDYTCPHCRTTHEMLQRLRTAYGQQIGVIVLPVPLDPRCNPLVPAGHAGPPQACALARLALAVWCSDAKKFGTIDRWLFAGTHIRLEDETRAFAADLVGAKKLDDALLDPRIDGLIHDDIQLYARCGSGQIPKLLIGSTTAIGAIPEERLLAGVIEKEWGIRP